MSNTKCQIVLSCLLGCRVVYTVNNLRENTSATRGILYQRDKVVHIPPIKAGEGSLAEKRNHNFEESVLDNSRNHFEMRLRDLKASYRLNHAIRLIFTM